MPRKNGGQMNWKYLLSMPFLLVLVVFIAWTTRASTASDVVSTPAVAASAPDLAPGIIVGHSYHNDVSPPLRDMPQIPMKPRQEHELNENPISAEPFQNNPDTVVQRTLSPLAMPTPILNFDGIPFPGVACNCAPPDTDGEVGATQYVQMVNEGYQVFNKTTSASLLGPSAIASVWSGFGGLCELNGAGDPVVLYDQLAGRWLISQFAGISNPTDECIAISTTFDATGSWNRYAFHLGSNYFDYPHLGVWPDAYYLGENVFNAAGTVRLGPQPFAFDRAAMLAGTQATFITTGLLAATVPYLLPADLDGSILPPVGAPNPFLGANGATWPLYRFHVDFVTPANSTFTLATSLAPAAFTSLCAGTRNCVPQLGSANNLDGVGDRGMFRSAYRRFADGHEALVGNKSVSSGAVAGIRWWELNNVTGGTPTFVQQSTYQPDTTWRWLGSAAMDSLGDLAVGFNASSATINPQIRYAGRLATDPINNLAQGEAHLFDGTGSQTGTGNRWGDYSDLTIDPVDDCTFWYTTEYYATTSAFNWRTRIGNFKFPTCVAVGATATPLTTNTPTTTATSTSTATRTSTPTNTAVATSTATSTSTNTSTSTATNTATSTATATNTSTNTATSTATNTATNTATSTATNSATATNTATNTATGTSTSTATNTAVSTSTNTTTRTPTSTASNTATSTNTATITATATRTNTSTNTPTATTTNTATATPTRTNSPTNTPSTTFAPTSTTTSTSTGTVSPVPTSTSTHTLGPSSTPTSTIAASATNTSTVIATATRTNTVVSTSTRTNTAVSTSTATNTALASTSTSTAIATAVSSATSTVAATSVASATATTVSTAVVGATNTPVPSSTSTAVIATSIPTATTSIATSTPCTIAFTDVPADSTFYIWIRCLACRGIISGYSDGTFRPGNDITRSQIAKMVSNAAGFSEDPGPQLYEDVDPSHTFYAWINRLSMRGHMGGYPCGIVPEEPCNPPDNRPYFRPFANATRGQLAKIVANAAGVGGSPTGLYYTDVPEDNPFYTWIMRLTNMGVMGGYPCGGEGEPCDDQNRSYFRPFANVTRGQASKIVANTFYPNCETPSR